MEPTTEEAVQEEEEEEEVGKSDETACRVQEEVEHNGDEGIEGDVHPKWVLDERVTAEAKKRNNNNKKKKKKKPGKAS